MTIFTDELKNIRLTDSIYLKPDYLNDPFISGNKLRKLKYNIEEAKKMHCNGLVTFGGAYSNHILALAAAGKMHNMATVGIIRGEELVSKINDNPTLSEFVSVKRRS